MKKKWIALFLSCTMVLNTCAVPVAASAADAVPSVVSEVQEQSVDEEQSEAADEADVQKPAEEESEAKQQASTDEDVPVAENEEVSQASDEVTKGKITIESNFDEIADEGDSLPDGLDEEPYSTLPKEIDFTQENNLKLASFDYSQVVYELGSTKYKLRKVLLKIGDVTLEHDIQDYDSIQTLLKQDTFTADGLFEKFGSDSYVVLLDDNGVDNSCFGEGALNFNGTLKKDAVIRLEFENLTADPGKTDPSESDTDVKMTLDNIEVTSRKAAKAELSVNASAAGKIWYLAQTSGEAPTAEEIMTKGTGVDLAAAGETTVEVSGLTKDATTVYMVLADGSHVSEVYSQQLAAYVAFLGKMQDSNGTVVFDDNGEATTFWNTDDIQYRLKLYTPSGATSDSSVNLKFTYTDTAGDPASTEAQFKNTYVWFRSGFIDYNGQGNDLHIFATKNGETQEYIVHVTRKAVLSGLTAEDENGQTVAFTPTFSKTNTDYTVTVLDNIKKLILKATDKTEEIFPDQSSILFNEDRSEDGTYEMAIQPGENKVVIKADNGAAIVPEYTLTVTQVASASLGFHVTPADAQVCLYDTAGKRIYPENGVYTLFPDTEYTYTAACEGYVGQKDTVTVTADEKSLTKDIVLEKAAESAPLPELDAEYGGFRADKNNQSVINAKTPITKESIEIKWERQVGTGVNPSSGSTPVIVDGKIYTQSAGKLYMLDKNTGEVLKSSDCFMNAGFNLIPVTYGDGMIFVPLGSGIQCFNATTLESLWTYENTKNGACNSPIRYDNGKVYVGFQNTRNDYFVCLTATDEDPSSQTESKVPLWTNYGDVGYWWAGAWTNEKYVFAVNQGGALMVMDNKTGETVQKIQTKATAVRSDVSYYNGRIYFSTQSGYLYSYNLDADGKVDTEHLIEPLYFGSASTCTPAIYNNRLYIGIQGGKEFGEDGASIMVVDINPETGAMSEVYLVPTPTDFGYCQTSGLISSGYEDEDGFVYVYFLCNNAKGALYMVKDKPGITSPEPESGLFYTPTHEQYCIASAVADKDGTLYIKNDSAWQFAIGRAESYIKSVEVIGGNAVVDDGGDFVGSKAEHAITVDTDTEEVTINLTPNEGTEVRMNGKIGNKQTIALNGEKTVVEVQLLKGDATRTYTFNIFRGPTLTSLKVTNNPNAGMGNVYDLDPAFDPMKTTYTAGITTSRISDSYIWLSMLNDQDTLTCRVVSGVSGKAEGDTLPLKVSYKGDKYFDVPFADKTTDAQTTAVVDLILTSAANSTQSRTYRVTMYTNGALPILTVADGAVTERTNDSAKITVTANKAGTILYLAQDTDAEAPDAEKIQSEGKSVEAVAGENVLNLTELTRNGYKVYMLLKQEDGAVSAIRSVELEKLWVLGDLDDNGTVELSDAVQLLDKVTAGETVDANVGDLNSDGIVDLNDAVQLLDKVTAE